MIKSFSHLANSDINTLEQMYQDYQNDPESVDKSWQDFFKGFDFALANFKAPTANFSDSEFKVINLIHAYRQRGHLFTQTNPVRSRRKYYPTLDIENFGLAKTDLEKEFLAGSEVGLGKAKLKDIIQLLEETYCESIGVEYLYLRDPETVDWLKNQMEASRNSREYQPKHKRSIYRQLIKAVDFEQFIHKKFTGQKRFSLEGAEGMIPALNSLILNGNKLGAKEFIIGMAHRGRLNVLANIMNKPYEDIFREFEGKDYSGHVALGDVKYHLGYGQDKAAPNGDIIRTNLTPNPSHLEAVLPVTLGLARAKIDHQHGIDYNKVVPVVIHGDAAIAGQGVVYETVQMAQLNGYKSGGTVHVVINNQVGFTTSYTEARSSIYSTDVAKVTRCPVFHVNGDDMEALIYTMQLAIEYRQKFHSDVFIDVLCYRKYGHNEGDEPRFTQPTLYDEIAKHPNPKLIYGEQLVKEGVYSPEDLVRLDAEFNNELEEKLQIAKQDKTLQIRPFLPKTWADYIHPDREDFWKEVQTGVSKEELLELSEKLASLPADLPFYKKVNRILDERKKLITSNKIDWALAELLAYASISTEGAPVRLSGQDAVRGTFAHRHSGFTIDGTEDRYFPIKHLSDDQAEVNIYNSNLSEYGVMGFEYGYALGCPKGLNIWEAQFGDFHNVAQVIIDQYISSGEEKWGLMNGLVLLLPHGFEGQGPEHSSARIERFLALSARENMQIMNLTTPSNLFHAFRRQVKRNFRVPMVIFTPKSLLRHPKCISTLEDLQNDTFKEVIDDNDTIPEKVTRIVFSTGKIYYDLLKRKQELDAKDVALVRIEQLHPFPKETIRKIVKRYPNALLNLWVQEEPENMGAWYYIKDEMNLPGLLPIARIKAGSPATGLKGLHDLGQEEIVNKVFKRCNCDLKLKYCGLQCVEGKSKRDILKQHYYFDEEARFSI